MFHLKYSLYFTLLHLIIATPQLNLYYTDWVSENERDNGLEHNCLRVATDNKGTMVVRQIISYCTNELPSKFNVENNDLFPKFTFVQLFIQNISSEQLYLWSAPIDVIERYQFYLNQLSTLNDSSLAKEIFYNCTMPRFGPKCQYELYYHRPDHSSFYAIIRDFYQLYPYKPTTFTCYTHLKCNRGPSPACLDWSEICDGKIDCLDGGFDEEHCWQLEINQCKDDEYRCKNGQCIPKSFSDDPSNSNGFDCVDGSDRPSVNLFNPTDCSKSGEPSSKCEDVTCKYTFLTSSCMRKREDLVLEAMHSIGNSSISKDCWSAFKCIIEFPDSENSFCNERCPQNVCMQIVKDTCPDLMYFPTVPVFFGDVYFVYRKNDSQYLNSFSNASFYICYNNSHYNDYFVNASKMLFDNLTCVHYEWFLFQSNQSIFSSEPIYQRKGLYHKSIFKLYEILKKYHLIFNYTLAICNRSNMYQCIHSSKCISIHRVMDTIYDCPHMDDENITLISNTSLMEQIKQTHFKCPTSNKYIPQSSITDGFCDCTYDGSCLDEKSDILYLQTHILFQHICDGFIDLLSLMIAERNETDETECEQWKCNNIYTRCNRVWNCPNGADESGCYSSSALNCSSKHHLCVSPYTNQFMCLPIEKANDGNVDCLGATDEPRLCGTNSQTDYVTHSDDFYCMNQTSRSCISALYLCDGKKLCEHGDDEQFCTTNRTSHKDSGVCEGITYGKGSNIETFLCEYRVPIRAWNLKHFKLATTSNSLEYQTKHIGNTVLSSSSIIPMSDQHQPRCHRGLDLRVWLNDKNGSTTNTCLCPPSYYGDQCQYQNQRISLIIQFRALSDSYQTPFAIVISLIDDSNERIIHSYEQITYLSVRHCPTKYNIYLLYSTRPKNQTKQYAIHIDFYEKLTLAYRGSVLLPVHFSFLPVHRLAFMVDIPQSDEKNQSSSNDQCIHGKCIKYSNNQENLTFCQCDPGWSGKYCTIQHSCICASDSLCIGVSANNQSICVCRMNKFGSRCLLTDTTCQTNDNSTCQNGGQCIPIDDYLIPRQTFECICQKGFNGDRCEFADNQLILSFNKNIALSQSQTIVIHLIELRDLESVRGSTFRTIPVRQKSVIIFWSRRFHLGFLELVNKNYYLIVVQNEQSTRINKTINPSDRCPHINELFNETFVGWDLIRRIKYYHLPCQNQSLNLSCFYDDVHLCICYNFEQQRLANCFNFDHNMISNCSGQKVCENDGQCVQDRPNCPTRSICVCRPCFYGLRCQLSTRGFGLSLDAILGYHISPNTSIINQQSIVQFSLAITIVFIVAGLINGIFCMITFKNKPIREVGCGLYLLGLSITTLLTTMMFGLKFSILLLAQMTIISNRSFLLFQCHSIDFVLRVCLCMDQWLNACVATERAITAIIGAGFVKKKSKQAAKLVIIMLLIVIIGSCIHDPIFRRLIDEGSNDDDDNTKRTWCIVSYGPILEVYNYIIHSFHFFGPFLINLISAIILIIKQSRQQLNIHKERSYKEILREQFREHKHLLTAPIVLVILALPRLIITFISKCMKSANDSWLFLVGYFISFIPPMLTFIVYILPSKFYKKEFSKSIHQLQTAVQRRLHLIK